MPQLLYQQSFTNLEYLMGPRRPPPLRDRPLDISTLTLVPQQRVPSKPRTASSASLGSSNSTNAKPGGFLATHTFLKGPYLLNALSISCLLADEPKLPTYTLQDKSHSR
jgi:hypothetical protein